MSSSTRPMASRERLQPARHRHDLAAHPRAAGGTLARHGRRRRARAGCHRDGAAAHLRRRSLGAPRLRGQRAADRPWPDDLAAVRGGHHDRGDSARSQRRSRAARPGCWKSAPARAIRPPCWQPWSNRSSPWSAFDRSWIGRAPGSVPWALRNVRTKHDDGHLGWTDEAPFDAVIVTAGASHVPDALMEQLSDGGPLVIPVGRGRDAGAQAAAGATVMPGTSRPWRTCASYRCCKV